MDRRPLAEWFEENQAKLTHLQRRVLMLRFGLAGEKEHSLAQVEEELEVSFDEIRSIEREILIKIRSGK